MKALRTARRFTRFAQKGVNIRRFLGMALAISALILSTAIFAPVVVAQSVTPPAPYANRQLDDPAKEAQAQKLMETIRCLTCQSQSIADSEAPLAGDMRHQIRTRIAAGEHSEAIRAWLVERYGDWVSYAPAVNTMTWPLWAAPLFLFALAAILLRGRLRRRRAKR